MNTKKHSPLRILLLMGTSYGYGRQLIDGVTQYLYEEGHHADFEFRGYGESVPRWMELWKGDGILLRDSDPATLAMVKRKRVPFVTLSCLDCPSDLTVDEDSVAGMVMNHFEERGLRHFAYFAQCDRFWTRVRRDAMLSEAARRNRDCAVFMRPTFETTPLCGWTEGERAALVRWLHELPRPCGLLAAHDPHAALILDLCRGENIAVPDEIAVMGTSNEEWFCRMQKPPLSSVIQNGRSIGRRAAQILCDRILGNPLPSLPLLLPPTGIQERPSTDRIAIGDEDMLRARQLIRERAAEGVTVQEILDAVLLSRRTLERKYKNAFGRTLGQDILAARMEAAKEMLRETDLPASVVASRLNFTSDTSFYHIFRRQTGMSPAEYRAANR